MRQLRTVRYEAKQLRVPSRTLRLLLWNVWYGSQPKQVLNAIEKFDCDALLLFEVDGGTGLPDLIQGLGYGGVFFETNCFGWRREVRGGIAVFSRLPVTAIRSVELRRGGRGALRGGSTSCRLYVEVGLRGPANSHLYFGGTHLSYELPFHGKECAQEQATLLSEIGKHASHYIFGGDLNALPNSSIVRRLNERLNHLGPNMVEPSWPMRRMIKGFLRPRRFDYAFATPDIDASAEFGNDISSDHNPLVLQVRVPSDP